MTGTNYLMDSRESLDNSQMGGKRRRNGHKYSCKCPICINMKHAKRGGDNDEFDKDLENKDSDDSGIGSQIAGRKKKANGHKIKCACPICQNMRKKGGDEDKKEDNDMKSNEIDAMDYEYENIDEDISAISGGKRSRKSRKSRRNKKTRKNRRRSHKRRR